jgi:hypothetical protein
MMRRTSTVAMMTWTTVATQPQPKTSSTPASPLSQFPILPVHVGWYVMTLIIWKICLDSDTLAGS